MGLSRNKVAVSEGAAGSPPFYGDSAVDQKDVLRTEDQSFRMVEEKSTRCSVFSDFAEPMEDKK